HPCVFTQQLYRTRADAPCRHIDDTLQRSVIIAIEQQAQISQCVLDLQTFIEALPSIDTVRHPLANQRLLKYPRLGVRAVEDRNILASTPLIDLFLDGIDNKARFVEIVEAGINRNRLATLTGGP